MSFHGRRRHNLWVTAPLVLAVFSALVGGCSRKLTSEDCAHLLGRGIGLAAAADGSEPLVKEMGIYGGVPVDIEALHKTATGPVREAITAFDRVCIGAPDDGSTVSCARRANNDAEFRACGDMVARAREAGQVARAAVQRKYNASQCATWAEHAVHIGAVQPDQVGKLVHECDDWMAIGYYECKLRAKDTKAWKGCETP